MSKLTASVTMWMYNMGRIALGIRTYVNIFSDLREVGCGCVDWIELAKDRDRWRALVSAVMNLRVP
jgi:hypothetical protein